MAVMTLEQRTTCAHDLMRDVSRDRSQIAGLTKAELRAAVDALDAWLSANAAAINTAIPQPARGMLTTPQKAQLLGRVILARYVNGV
jgi:hypothetical protein